MHSSIVLILHDIIYAYHVAAQMWLLGRILPLVIGDLVPNDDERWSNFLLMMEIVDILFCPNLCDFNAQLLLVTTMSNLLSFILMTALYLRCILWCTCPDSSSSEFTNTYTFTHKVHTITYTIQIWASDSVLDYVL